MARQWTPAQSAAMQYKKTSLLVSAAAGSGKTATLTQRIINQITEDESCTLERMLIVTFTRAAAAELRARIASALTEAIAQDPGNRHLNHQLLLLPGAHIHTIDAFFGEPVRANFERLGLPAGFRMADDGEADGMHDRVLHWILVFDFRDGEFLAYDPLYVPTSAKAPNYIRIGHDEMEALIKTPLGASVISVGEREA